MRQAKTETADLITITKEQAAKLDTQINQKIQAAANQLAKTYLEIGGYLKQMRESEGFKLLGFEKWDTYLDSKSEFGRTYLSYLYKLGQAGEPQQFLDRGLSGSKLIEFAKHTDFPEKIPQLIEATWDDIKDKSARGTAVALNKYVKEHEADYRRQKMKKGGRPKLSFNARLHREYQALSISEQAQYVAELKTFLKEVKEAQSG